MTLFGQNVVMARLEDIDGHIELYLQFLREIYAKTNPTDGEESESSKHELAQRAVENFWYLQGKLLSWAQAHLTGYAILIENPELVGFLEEKLGFELHEDSHILETLGYMYNFNPPDEGSPAAEEMLEMLEEFNDLHPGHEECIFPVSAVRRTVIELMMSRCADNSYWRFPLQESLRALNEGEVDTFSEPLAGKRQGLPHSLNRWKLEALRQVRFRVGTGYKKYRALEEVSVEVGQSTETLRSWEKDLQKDHDREVDLYCSELAGQFDSTFRTDQRLAEPNSEDYGVWRGLSHIDNARLLHERIVNLELSKIRDALKKFRQKMGPEQ